MEGTDSQTCGWIRNVRKQIAGHSGNMLCNNNACSRNQLRPHKNRTFMQMAASRAGNVFVLHCELQENFASSVTVCPSGLRGWTQVPLARAAWAQIPQLSFHSLHQSSCTQGAPGFNAIVSGEIAGANRTTMDSN